MPLRLFVLPLTVLVVALVSTVAVSLELRDAIAGQDRERFEAAADTLRETIQARIDTYIAMLRAGAGLVAATDAPTLDQFQAFVGRLKLAERYPGVQGIGFTQRIARDRLEETIAAQRRAGRADFRIWPEHPRDEYHAILYLEPLDRRNAAAIGFDMFTEETRRLAMARARDSGDVAASGLVTLVQEIDEEKQPGFLIYVPVYEGGTIPDRIEARRALLRGFVYSPFRAADLFAGILGTGPRPRAGFELFDGAPSDATLVHRIGEPSRGGPLTTTRTIDVAGRQWTAAMFSTVGLEQSSSAGLVPVVTWAGAGISLVLTALVFMQARARERAEQSELEAASASRSLQQHAHTLEVINRTGAELAGELELDRLVQTVTDAGTQLTAAQFGAFFYNLINDAGESYTLYALSGVPREAFANFPMPRNTSVFAPTFRGEGIIRSDDITADPRYGRNAPHHGMPRGHLPVRSYLAVPVKSRSGEVLGALFFGHERVGVFTAQSEAIIAGVAAQTAIAIDNARLYGTVQQLLGSERVARAEAERVSRMKDEFLAVLSHELRTPLNAIMGWAHMLNSGALTEDKRLHALESILRNAQAQSRLIEDLLDMSRIISGRLAIELTDVDLREVADAAVNVVRPSAASKGVELTGPAGSEAFPVRGDAGRLQQIVWNLLTNAIKFTPAGGSVGIALRNSGSQVELSVVDSGAGIPPEFVPFVFDRFRQADASFARGHGGLGLGLSIVRSLVELHGGRVGVTSAGANQGTTFTVTLPRAAAPVRGGVVPGDTAEPPTADPGMLAGLHVLVVDDDVDGRELTAELLAQQGARVTLSRSGREALSLLDADGRHFDLLVSDVGMPDMDGYDFMRRLRASTSPCRAIPALALTAYAGGDDRVRALAAGFDRHLAKPLDPAALIAAAASLRSRATP